jgi:type I restriction enzyme, S subunit
MSNWKTAKIGELRHSVTSGSRGWARYYSDSGSIFLRITNLVRNCISLDLRKLKFVSLPGGTTEGQRTGVRPEDILISITAEPGLIGLVRPDFKEDAYVSQHIALLRIEDAKIDNRFVAHLLTGPIAQRRFSKVTDSGAKAGLNLAAIRHFPIKFPPLPEQRKIADILTTWDEALEKLDALITAKELRKKALMQLLLSGKRRLPRFSSHWNSFRLGDVLEFTPRITPKPSNPYLAAGIRSHGRGVFLKPDFPPENIALTELFMLKEGDFVLNITFAWEGAAAIVGPEADGALVSHRFPTFTFKPGKLAASFFRHYILTKRFVVNCGLASPGGAGRNRVLSKPTFLKIALPLPPFEEQKRIGALLDTAAQELTLLRHQRTALDQQKRGLMQRLLTGKLRVRTT